MPIELTDKERDKFAAYLHLLVNENLTKSHDLRATPGAPEMARNQHDAMANAAQMIERHLTGA